MTKYEIILYWSEEDEAFIAEVPELPGCAADGGTPQEAPANAETAIQGICLPDKTAAEPLPGITNQRINVDVFDGLTVSFVFPVHASAASGLPHIDPVGRSVAGSSKAMGVH